MMPAVRYPGPQWNNVVSQQVAEAHFQKRELPSIVNVADISHCVAYPGSCPFHAYHIWRTSVADPGSEFFHPGSRVKKIPDPH